MAHSAVLDPIDEIRKADADVGQRQRQLEDLARRLLEEGPEDVTGFAGTARAWVTRFHERLPGALPPDAQNEIRALLLNGVGSLDEEDVEARIIDHIDALLVTLEAVRHVLRDAMDEELGDDIRSAGDAVRQIDEWVPSIDRPTLADILGVTPRTLQRWLRDGGDLGPRARLVTRLIGVLRRSWTPEGVVAWFYRRRRAIGGRRALDLLAHPEDHETLLVLARQGRSGHGD